MNRIDRLFSERKRSKNKIMSLFLTAGFPEPQATVELVRTLADAGADMIELGMPFSDPLADGPTIQYSSNVAISHGTNIDMIFEMVAEIRETSEIPINLMGYINPVLHYGVEDFCKKAASAGVDGLILPDVPPEEASVIESFIQDYGMYMIYLVAPNTTDHRMRLIDDLSHGFVYCVSVTGVTGARSGSEVERSVNRFIERVKANIQKNPIMIGFGIKSHEDAVRISRRADGYFVGSALIDVIKKHYPNKGWMEKVGSFARELKYGATDKIKKET